MLNATLFAFFSSAIREVEDIVALTE